MAKILDADISQLYCKLIMVTSENNNKFYEMIHDGTSPNFTCKYGRVELTSVTISKPIREWNSVYREKVNKGYKDVTSMVAVDVVETKTATPTSDPSYADISIASVKKFVDLMRSYTNDLVKNTYSVKADKVSKKQVETAQAIIDELTKLDKTKTKEVNDKLIELYGIIPRFMSHVSRHILPSIDFDKAMVQEQDNLDAMASQVYMMQEAAKPKDEKKSKAAAQKQVINTFLQAMGVDIVEVTPAGKKNFQYILDQLNGRKIESVFEVIKPAEDERFKEWMKNQKNVTTKHLIHGTRCTSVIPILREGLKIRPVGNFQFSGKAYGDGNYFSEVTAKSLGYTGYDKDQILLVYEVHTGNPFTYDGWYRGNLFPLNYTELQKRGYDSTYVKAGNGLLNSEIIAYKEPQARIKYIIWLKR